MKTYKESESNVVLYPRLESHLGGVFSFRDHQLALTTAY